MSTPLIAAISALTPRIEGGGLITPRTLEEVLTSAYGSPASTGAWIWRTAYDALEGAAAKALSLGAPASLDALISAERRRPTQTRRSERQNRLQQFSTPLPYAAVAAHAAQLGAGDLVLEPSAGCGALAAAARTAGARLVLNEIDPQRREILASIFGAAPLGHDAAMIDDLLSPATSPSVVLMNPPFASSVASQDDPTIAARHLLSALKRLAPGGRLVAIMPMAFSPARQPALWRGFAARARIHMAMAVPGAVYARQGTTVTTQLIVADRIDDAGDDGCAFGPVADLESGDGPAALHALTRAVETHAPSRAPIVRAAPATARARTAAPASRRTAPAAPAPVRPAIQPLAYAVLAEPRVNQPVSDVYAAYRPQRVEIAGAQPHPTSLVESVAMASVAPPAPAAQPNLPLRLIERGGLSEAQLETAIYAREAHERLLSGRWIVSEDGREIDAAPEDAPEDGVRACRFRRGFFLGDGTGCGKGRQVASILLDNWLEGRRRALWVSKSDKLFEDACRDWSDVGGSPSDIKPLSRWKTDEPITAATAILFTTYATLRSVSQAGGRRLDQIVDWLTAGASDGDDAWGPVIAFDEAHAMGNAAGTKGSDRGASKPSQQGLAGLMLQAAIPAARVLYVSATGATTVENLAYASRLGLWGQHPDYPFPSRDAFLTAMNAGGVAAMEVVARDLKAMGVYIARSLSFEGVEYELIEHRLTGRQRALYDEWAGAFRIIHRNLGAALKATNLDDPDGGCNDARRKSAVMSRFESLKQRFFNHLVTGMKTPAAIEQIGADLAAGHSAVVQLVSTGEALLDRRLAQMNPDEMTDPIIDLTPREYVLDYLAQGFPTALMDVREDEGGNTYTTPVLDEAGAVAQSREAIAMRDAMIEKLALLDSVPAALDQLVWAFGPDAIAEATGRSKRPIVINDAAGRRLRIETRSAAANVSETRAFMDGAKRVLVFSEAGGTGRSYHAALTARNRQRRIHYLLEPGW